MTVRRNRTCAALPRVTSPCLSASCPPPPLPPPPLCSLCRPQSGSSCGKWSPGLFFHPMSKPTPGGECGVSCQRGGFLFLFFCFFVFSLFFFPEKCSAWKALTGLWRYLEVCEQKKGAWWRTPQRGPAPSRTHRPPPPWADECQRVTQCRTF